jgi:hypothetical protein
MDVKRSWRRTASGGLSGFAQIEAQRAQFEV